MLAETQHGSLLPSSLSLPLSWTALVEIKTIVGCRLSINTNLGNKHDAANVADFYCCFVVESGNLLIKICSPIGLISAESPANFMAE